MDYNKEINSIIERALTEKTFNLEIIEEIKKLRELPGMIEEANKRIEVLVKENTEIFSQLNVFKGKEADLVKREEEITKRERAQELTDVKNQSKDLILKEYKDVMNLVFRNTTVRENIYSNKQVQVSNNGYSSQMPESENINREITKE